MQDRLISSRIPGVRGEGAFHISRVDKIKAFLILGYESGARTVTLRRQLNPR